MSSHIVFSRLPDGVPGPLPRLVRTRATAAVAVVTPGAGGPGAVSRPAGRRVWHTRTVDFYSVYDQGFARVAACTLPVTIADPRGERAPRCWTQARACDDEGVAVALFPELVPDRLLHRRPVPAGDACSTQVEAAIADLVAASADLRPCSWSARRCGTATGCSTARVVVHRGRVLGVAPKSYLPTYREFYERRHFAPGDDRRGATIAARRARRCRSARTCCSRPTDVPGLRAARRGLRGHVGAGAAQRRGRAGRRDRAAEPVRQPDHRGPRRGPPAAGPVGVGSRCLAAYVYAAAGQGESSTDLSWDGQTMVYEIGELLAETERFPDGPRRSVADVDLMRLRQERLRQGTFDDNRRTHDGRAARRSARSRFDLDPPPGDLGLRRKVDRFPFVPDDPERLALDCYEAYNIQVSGLEQRLQAIGDPKVVIGVSGGLDSTHALIVAAKAMDRLGRPRSDILAFTMPGLRDQRGHQGQRDPAVQGARRHLRGARHPAGRAADARRPRPPVRRAASRSTT